MKNALTAEEWAGLCIGADPEFEGSEKVVVLDDEKIRWRCNETIGDEPNAVVVEAWDFYYGAIFVGQERHGLAALCLHGQPFGFTREDVRLLRFFAESNSWDGIAIFNEPFVLERWSEDIHGFEAIKALKDVADRIEALLPPEDG